MEVMSYFDRTWLVAKINWKECVSQALASPKAARSEKFRNEIEQVRAAIAELFQDGDEVWNWCSDIESISYDHGIVLLRGGNVVRAWCRGFTM